MPLSRMEERIRSQMEEASYANRTTFNTSLTLKIGRDYRQSLAERAYTAINKEENPNTKFDYELRSENNDRFTALYSRAESNAR